MEVSTVDPDLGDNGTDFFTLSETFEGLFNITTLPNNRVSLLGLYCSKLHNRVSLLGLYCSKLHTLC